MISIKTIRTERGMTQKELADKLKVDQSAVSQWESGHSGPKRNRLVEISNVLECSIDDLMRDDE